MSLDVLRQRAQTRMLEKAQQQLNVLQGLSFRPAGQMQDGTMLPAVTLEEIAVNTLVCNAIIRAYADANTIIGEEYKKLVDPHGQKQEQESETDDKEGIYG